MKNKKILLVTALFTLQIGLSQINTPSGVIQGNSGASTNVGIGTANGVIPNAKLEILSTTNQLRLSNTSTIFSNIQTNSSGYLLFNLSNAAGRIGFGTTAPAVGFHSNMGQFMISDPTPLSGGIVRGMQIVPNRLASTDMPSGALIISNCNTSGEGLSLGPNGTGAAGVKLGAYAFSSSGWKSMWETSNTIFINPDLLLVKNGGNVGIGTGAAAPTAKLEVAGQVKITGGTPGANKVLTSDATGLASWQPVSGLLSGGTANYLPKWTSANSLSSTSLIYDNGTNVGIGTNTPYKKLNVIGDVAFGTNNGNSSLEILGNGQVPSRRGISIDNDPSGKFNFYIHSWQTNAGFYFKDSNGDKTLVSINSSGNMKIGNQNILAPHANAELAVGGKIVCQSLYVLKPTSWADYVFKNKDLEKLETVEKYINENKHLPGIPSEEEIYTHGYNINEMDAKLLEKIETLYLHIIALEKEIKELKNK
jgi:hypothetical protein